MTILTLNEQNGQIWIFGFQIWRSGSRSWRSQWMGIRYPRLKINFYCLRLTIRIIATLPRHSGVKIAHHAKAQLSHARDDLTCEKTCQRLMPGTLSERTRRCSPITFISSSKETGSRRQAQSTTVDANSIIPGSTTSKLKKRPPLRSWHSKSACSVVLVKGQTLMMLPILIRLQRLAKARHRHSGTSRQTFQTPPECCSSWHSIRKLTTGNCGPSGCDILWTSDTIQNLPSSRIGSRSIPRQKKIFSISHQPRVVAEKVNRLVRHIRPHSKIG
mmetsp:Transcript_87852/g.155527  ORF Transcript_87852/g.155527 Transcript_87852/m.155527 type:complete len:273 (-) Transcript_87852:292-1110(-)